MQTDQGDGGGSGGAIVKVMSLSRAEFDNSLAAFMARSGYTGRPVVAGDAAIDDAGPGSGPGSGSGSGSGPGSVSGSVTGTATGASSLAFAVGEGRVIVRYVPLAAATFGGLLQLPRAEVSLQFVGVDAIAQQSFLEAFDMAFQRGGG